MQFDLLQIRGLVTNLRGLVTRLLQKVHEDQDLTFFYDP